jgi:hypothetical protein
MSVRVLILSIFLVLVLFAPNLNASELDSLELQKYLDESLLGTQMSDEGLLMIEAPLNEIDNLQLQKEQRLLEIAKDLQGTAQDLTQRELNLVLKETLSNVREQGLNEREKVIDSREKDLNLQSIIFEDTLKDLARANHKLENSWKWLLGSLIVGATIGIATDEFIKRLGKK